MKHLDQEIQKTMESLDGMQPVPPPADLAAQVASRLEQEATSKKRPIAIAWQQRLAIAAALATLVVNAGLVAHDWQLSDTTEQSSSLTTIYQIESQDTYELLQSE